jgi:predicted nucleic acid-binding protein
LVDTSVWIAFFRDRHRIDLEAIAGDEEILTCLPVVQEVLQGFRDEAAYRTARAALLAMPTLESPMSAGRLPRGRRSPSPGSAGRPHGPLVDRLPRRRVRAPA